MANASAPGSGQENRSEPDISGARGGGLATDETPGAEARSFQTKPGDVEPTGPGMGPVEGAEPPTGASEIEAGPTRRATGPVTEAEMSEAPDPERTDRAQRLKGAGPGNP